MLLSFVPYEERDLAFLYCEIMPDFKSIFFLILECSQLVLLKDFYGWAKQSLDSITGTMKQLDT